MESGQPLGLHLKKRSSVCQSFGRTMLIQPHSVRQLRPFFSLLSASPSLYTSLEVVLKEQMNTHENKMSSNGRSSWLVLLPPPEATFDICSKGKDPGLSKYEI